MALAEGTSAGCNLGDNTLYDLTRIQSGIHLLFPLSYVLGATAVNRTRSGTFIKTKDWTNRAVRGKAGRAWTDAWVSQVATLAQALWIPVGGLMVMGYNGLGFMEVDSVAQLLFENSVG